MTKPRVPRSGVAIEPPSSGEVPQKTMSNATAILISGALAAIMAAAFDTAERGVDAQALRITKVVRPLVEWAKPKGARPPVVEAAPEDITVHYSTGPERIRIYHTATPTGEIVYSRDGETCVQSGPADTPTIVCTTATPAPKPKPTPRPPAPPPPAFTTVYTAIKKEFGPETAIGDQWVVLFDAAGRRCDSRDYRSTVVGMRMRLLITPKAFECHWREPEGRR